MTVPPRPENTKVSDKMAYTNSADPDQTAADIPLNILTFALLNKLDKMPSGAPIPPTSATANF